MRYDKYGKLKKTSEMSNSGNIILFYRISFGGK